jgi:hypothetical protein
MPSQALLGNNNRELGNHGNQEAQVTQTRRLVCARHSQYNRACTPSFSYSKIVRFVEYVVEARALP